MENRQFKATTYLKVFIIAFLLMLAHTCAVSQTLGVPVYKYQKKVVLNDSTVVYYNSVSERGWLGEKPIDIFHDEYYLEVNDTCVQVVNEYLGDYRVKYAFALAKLGFTKFTDEKYYRGNKTVFVSFDGTHTKVVFTLQSDLVENLDIE